MTSPAARPPVPEPGWTTEQIVAHLRSLGSAHNIAGMARFGINTGTALGIGNTPPTLTYGPGVNNTDLNFTSNGTSSAKSARLKSASRRSTP